MDHRVVKDNLDNTEKAIHYDLSSIKEEERFDFLFYWIRHLESSRADFDAKLVEQTSDILESNLDKCIKKIQRDLSRNSPQEEIDELRTQFKMIVFLVFYYLHNTCIRKVRNNIKDELQNAINHKESSSAPANNNKKKEKGAKKDQKDLDVDNLIKKQIRCIQCLHKSLQVIEFSTLFNKRAIDDEFFKYYVQTSLRMLESNQLFRDENVKKLIFSIIEMVLSRCSE